VLGLCSLGSPLVLAENLKRLSIDPGKYRGPLLAKIRALLDRLDRGEILASDFVNELSHRYGDIDLLDEFRPWLEGGHDANEMMEIFKKRTPDHLQSMSLFFIAPNAAHPPHAHHDLMSVQCVLRGKVRLRQYDRVSRVDPKHLTLRLTRDAKLGPGGRILMTETKDNVHWFGTDDEPAVILNFNVSGTAERTFDVPGSRNKARYYLDPLSEEADGGLILAEEIDKSEAHRRFARHSLRDFPVAGIPR
jgi:hypothetical protein